MTLDRTHLILTALLIILALFGVYAIEARIADNAGAKAQLAEQHAADVEKANAAFQAATQAQIDALKDALNAREITEAKQGTQNRVLTAPQVATQIGEVAKVAPLVTQGDTVVFPLPLAQTALTDMQLVPLLTQDKSDLTKSLELEKASHASDIQACKVEVKAAQAETIAAKARAKKSWLKGFFVGIVVGFAGRSAL